MQIIDCIGSPRERGQSHGEALRDRIATALHRWEAATMAGLAGRAPKDFDSYCTDFLATTGLLNCAEAVTPDLVTELRGIAEGAGQPFARMAVYNLMDEQWWHDADLKAPPLGCSLIAQKISDGHVLAQNMDLPAHMEGSQVALRLDGPDIPQTIVLTAAGLIGLTGATAAGLAIGVNTLLMLAHSAQGLPVAFALRHALAARSPAAAEARLREIAHASGQHYALICRDEIRSLECSARSMAEVAPAQAGLLLHTNHPLASDDIDPQALARLGNGGFTKSSETRLDWLRNHVSSLLDVAQVQALFDDQAAPLCMRPETNGGSSTFASVLYELTDRPRLKMRQGGAGAAPWAALDFSV